MKTLFYIFLLCLSATFSTAQNKKILDSLNIVYQNLKQDTSKVKVLVQIAMQYNITKPDTAFLILSNASKIVENKGYKNSEALILLTQAKVYINQKNYTQAIPLCQKSLLIYEKLKDENKLIDNYYQLGSCYHYLANYEQATEWLKKSLYLSEKVQNNSFINSTTLMLGVIYLYTSNYELALNYFYKNKVLNEKLNNELALATVLSNIGIIYFYQNDYDKALDCYNKSKTINEKLNNQRGIATSLTNIGTVYSKKKDFQKSLEYFRKSLVINEAIKNSSSIASCYTNIADCFVEMNKYEQAIEAYQKSIEIKTQLKDKYKLIFSYAGIAVAYRKIKDYEKSVECAQKALDYGIELKSLQNISEAYLCLYATYKDKDEANKALHYYELYKQMNDSIFNVEKSKSIANLESRMALEKKEKEFTLLAKDNELNKLAVEKQARELEITKKQAEAEQLLALARAEKDKRKQDSLYNLAQKSKLEAENMKTKEENNKLANEKEKLAHLAELEQQKRIRNTFLGLALTALLMIILGGIGYYQKQKSNKLLAQQNDEIKFQNQEIKRQQTEISEKNYGLSQANEELFQQQEELKSLNDNLEGQKQEIELTYAQLKTTSDALGKSISYASNIQGIILADVQQLQSFFEDIFILYYPRDVVSGDFYWFSEISTTQSIFVLADCTGHGVPGAFMSMLGSTLLDEVVNERKLYASPSEILKFLHQRLRKILKQDEGKNLDGMDISIAYFEKENQTTKVRFAGAKSHAYYITGNQLNMLNGDRIYLGGKNPTVEFTNKEVTVTKNTIFYFFTDGFADQNNAERQKFGSKNFQDLLFSIHHLPLKEQQNVLEDKLQIHQGQEEQRDDISVLGIKI